MWRNSIMSLDIKELRKIAEEATQERQTECLGNYPFYVDVRKPAPSLSKHDDERPTYWRYQDGVFVLTFDPKTVIMLLDQIEDLEKKLDGSRNYHDSKDRLWRKAVVERAETFNNLKIAAEALEKIADPRKRDHKEPDDYTTLACVMTIADKALSDIRDNNKQGE